VERDVIFVDANVPMYAAGKPHPMKDPCIRIVAAAARAAHAFVSDAEVLQELLHVSRRRLPADGPSPYASFAAVMADRVLAVEGRDVVAAARLGEAVPEGVSTKDLVHAAVMQRHGIARIVTADRDFDRVPDVERLDPARLAEWEDPAWFS